MKPSKEQIDNFLAKIMQVESSGGHDIDHPEIKTGIHKGDSAIGRFALMPNTIDEMVRRAGKSDKSLKALLKMSPEEKEEFINSNPEIEMKLGRQLATHVLKKQGGDEAKAAYAWLYGHNLSPDKIEKKNYLEEDYVKKFQAVTPKLKERNQRTLAESLVTPEESELLKQYLSRKEPDSALESAGKGWQQGLSAGFADEIGAASGALGAKYAGSKDDLVELYKEIIPQLRDEYKASEKQNPGSFTSGNVIGSLMFPAGPMVSASKGVVPAAKAGMAVGGLYGLGTSEGTPQEIGEQTAKGMTLGGIAGAGTGLAGQQLPKLKSFLIDKADELYNAGKGSQAKMLEKIAEKFPAPKPTSFNDEELQLIGLKRPEMKSFPSGYTAEEAEQMAGQEMMKRIGMDREESLRKRLERTPITQSNTQPIPFKPSDTKAFNEDQKKQLEEYLKKLKGEE